MSLLEQNTTRKGQVDKNTTKLAELDVSHHKGGEYKVKAICNSAVYAKESADYLPRLYYLVFLEKLSRRKKYLGVYIDYSAS